MSSPSVTTELKNNYTTYSITASSATSDEIPYGEFSKAGFVVSALATAATVNFYGAEKAGGTYRPIYDSTNTIKAQGVAVDRAYAMPTEAAGFNYVMLVANAGTLTAILSRKS